MHFTEWTFPEYTFYCNGGIRKDISREIIAESTFFESTFHSFSFFTIFFVFFFLNFFIIYFQFFIIFCPFFSSFFFHFFMTFLIFSSFLIFLFSFFHGVGKIWLGIFFSFLINSFRKYYSRNVLPGIGFRDMSLRICPS